MLRLLTMGLGLIVGISTIKEQVGEKSPNTQRENGSNIIP